MDQVSTARINARLHHLESYGTRFVSSSQAPVVAGYLQDELAAYGWETELQEFSFQHDTLGIVTSWNVIARRAGTNPDALIALGAHWDTINASSPGGSWDNPQAPAPGVGDNGSGVAALLEIARVARFHPFRQNVEIVFFGAEEQWLQGSRHYVAQHMAAGTNIAGFYNIDTISYDIDGPWDFSLLSDHASLWLMWDAVAVCRDYEPELEPISMYVPDEWSNSDVYPFWAVHYPAVSVWEGVWYQPEEHGQHGDTPDDTYANSVPDGGAFITAMTRFALAAFCVWADLGPLPAGSPDLPAGGEAALSLHPNPFRESVTIRPAREGGQIAGVEIFDLGGRRVRRLEADGGEAMLWDGRGQRGERLAAGVYLLRPVGGGPGQGQRAVLLR